VAFGLGVGLFVLAALLVFAVFRSSITNMWVLVGCIVLAAALMSVYAIANFVDSSHIPRRQTECGDQASISRDWLGARRSGVRDGARLIELARLVERCNVVGSRTGADVRTLLGPPDRRAGASSRRVWEYVLRADVSSRVALRVEFLRGHAVSARTVAGAHDAEP
jgi:hypothetical protein